MDGIDTRGEPQLGLVADDQFVGILLTSDVQARDHNFGERGLRNPSKKLELASTELNWDALQLPKLPDDQLDTFWVQWMGPPSGPVAAAQNPRQPLDVSNDGNISAIDALLIFNQLNAGSSGSTALRSAGLSQAGLAGPYLDTSGDGQISAIDALIVINYLNRRSADGEGEDGSLHSVVSSTPPLSGEPASALGAENSQVASLSSLEDLLDLLASDIEDARRKKR